MVAVNNTLIPLKFLLLIFQGLLFVALLNTRVSLNCITHQDFYIYAANPLEDFNSDSYKTADKEIQATTMTGLALTFCEFVFLGLGWTLTTMKINVCQVILHFLGVCQMCSIILVGLPYTRVRSALFWFAGIPFLLEAGVGIYLTAGFKIMSFIEERRRNRFKAVKRKYH